MRDIRKPDNDFQHLYPPFGAKVKAAVDMLNIYLKDPKTGYAKYPAFPKAALFEGYRSVARQEWLYQQGRTREGDIVTKSRTPKYHGFGLAADIAFRTPLCEWTWDAPDACWNLWGHCVRAQGLEWAGDWKRFPEGPHCQPKPAACLLWRPQARQYLNNLGLKTP